MMRTSLDDLEPATASPVADSIIDLKVSDIEDAGSSCLPLIH